MKKPGNPGFGTKYKSEPIGDEPLKHSLHIRVTQKTYNRIKAIKDKQIAEFVREAINKALDEYEEKEEKPALSRK